MDENLLFLVLCAVSFTALEVGVECQSWEEGRPYEKKLVSTETIVHPPNHIKNCSKCPPGWGAVKKCTTSSNTECVKCIPGETYSSHRSSKSPCFSCSQCGVGLYESHRCSPVRDTICSECVAYLDHKNLLNSKDFVKQCAYLFLK